ncbi:receptor-like serine/threonine-protein kinase SD1-8 [Rosa sericea]
MKILRAASVFLCIFFCFFVCSSHATDTLRPGQYLRRYETLVSDGGVFELGFFYSPTKSVEGYLGIWLKNDKKKRPVWVANRDDHLMDPYAVLYINPQGMVISDNRNSPFFFTYGAPATTNRTSARILDSGNLILMEGGKTVWQSFDNLVDTFLPGMKMGMVSITNAQLKLMFLLSWKRSHDPTCGVLGLSLDNSTTQVDVWHDDGKEKPIGHWDGHEFKFVFKTQSDNYNFSYVLNSKERYLTFNNKESNVYSWFALDSDGKIQEFMMVGQKISVVSHSVCGDCWLVSSRDRKLLLVIKVVVPLTFSILMLILFLYCLWRKHNSLGIYRFHIGRTDSVKLLLSQLSSDDSGNSSPVIELGKTKDHALPTLSFSCIVASTNNFSVANKLGEGGYGPVYKGNLLQHDIAVKRLSKRSGQGLVEFKNEVQLISQLQHRNLVKILGCCIQREEKILIYEYMSNRSLDSFIFDPIKRRQLNWRQRIHIIEGIAQGLLYLHKYSRLRIIHRDLKTSNILLDAYMNPKISDFGLARILSGNECGAETKRIAGTFGYMSPEYVLQGLLSTKSDVFSFGVIVLEIMSGMKNATFYESDYSLNLLGHAWNLWISGRCEEMIDPTLADSSSRDGLVLCIQVGLLCVQDCAEDRPTMSEVVSMLSTEGASLPKPKQPMYSNLMSEVDKALRSGVPSENLLTYSSIVAR